MSSQLTVVTASAPADEATVPGWSGWDPRQAPVVPISAWEHD